MPTSWSKWLKLRLKPLTTTNDPVYCNQLRRPTGNCQCCPEDCRFGPQGDILPEDVDIKMFSDMLYTKDVPDPDLVIRTSGEQRISNYLLWQIAYAEFFFTPTLWPDFGKEELERIINDFNTRERRYGKV